MVDEEKGKRPAWYHPYERATYDAAHMRYDEFRAKMLSEDELKEFDVPLPAEWKNPPLAWLTGNGSKKGLPQSSGQGIVQSPYTDLYGKTYGLVPTADLPKYRLMYRNYPDVQQAIEMQTNLAVGKGYIIKHPQKKVAKYITDALIDIDMPQHALTMAAETLTYGNSYTEVLWSESEESTEKLYDYKGNIYAANELKKFNIESQYVKPAIYTGDGTNQSLEAVRVNRKPKSELLGLKDLDPVYMRVRRDAWNNIFGYIQWMSFPPVLLDVDTCIHIKNRPKSTGYESAYGISILMSLIKNTSLLDYFENDAAIWMHYKAVPPITVKGGMPEKPYGTEQMIELNRLFAKRSAASTIVLKGDVAVEEMRTVAADLHIDWWINYLLLKRTQALGVPSFLMGSKETAGRSSAQVMILEFITRLQILQECISRPIEKYIIRPLIDEKFGKSVPIAKIVWKPIIEETPDMRPQRLIQLLQAGAVTVNEVRVEMGFEELEGSEYNKPMPVGEPAMNPSGFPAKPGALPNEQKVPKNTPESRQKTNPTTENNPKQSTNMSEKEIRKQRVLELMKMDDDFRERISNIVGEARMNLRCDDILVKDAKKDFLNKVSECINIYGDATYILEKYDGDKNASLEIDDNEGYAVEAYRNEIFENMEKTFENIVKLKEEGRLLNL